MNVRAIDVMGFAGGFTLGAVQAGFELVGKREEEGGFGVLACESNRHLLGDNWRTETTKPENWTVEKAEYVFGNPPCSGFSAMSEKQHQGRDSKINQCMWHFVNYVSRVKPQIAVFESVQLAYSKGRDLMQDLRFDLETRTGIKWDLYHVLHNAYSLGGPAQRRRYFWVAVRKGMPFGVSLPKLQSLPTLHDVIGDLVPQPLDWALREYYPGYDSSWYSGKYISFDGYVDGHNYNESAHTLRIQELMENDFWKQGEYIRDVQRRYYTQFGKLPAGFKDKEEELVKRDFFQGFNKACRWRWSDPARVITGDGPLIAWHPQFNRPLTYREIARVMGFVDDWFINPMRGKANFQSMWGKGITVDCGRWISTWVKNSMYGQPGDITGDLIGEDEYLIDVTNAWKNTVVI